MIFTPFILCLALLAPVQEADAPVRVIRLADLDSRIEQGLDTVYVVNFWATWCKPCIAELPVFDRLHRDEQGKPLTVLLVSLDDPEDLADVVIPFVKRKGLRPECVLLDETSPNEWIDKVDESWSGAIPATLMVDSKSGRRQFFEQDFTIEELRAALAEFRGETE